MYIKRTKSTFSPEGKVLSTRVHFAAKVAPAGNVTEWSDDPAKAAPLPEEACLRALDFYGKRASQPVGVVEAVDRTDAKPNPKAQSPKTPAA